MAATAFLFDLDGTLWDSWPLYADVLARTGSESADRLEEALHAGQSVVTLARSVGLNKRRLTKELTARIRDLTLYPDVKSTLLVLKGRDLPLGVVTSLPGTIANPLLEASSLSDFFPVVIHAGNCRVRKPSAAPVIAALQELRMPGTPSVFFVGDMVSDCQAGVRAGISFGWARYGYGKEAPQGATITISKFSEIAAL